MTCDIKEKNRSLVLITFKYTDKLGKHSIANCQMYLEHFGDFYDTPPDLTQFFKSHSANGITLYDIEVFKITEAIDFT